MGKRSFGQIKIDTVRKGKTLDSIAGLQCNFEDHIYGGRDSGGHHFDWDLSKEANEKILNNKTNLFGFESFFKMSLCIYLNLF